MKSYNAIYRINAKNNIKYWFWGMLLFFIIIMFLPWTQNIKANGKVTTLYQDQRPQEINSPIPGKIVKWYVKEGDFVKKGDTILKIAEIKEDYLDPNLITRTQQQVEAKKGAVIYYKGKVKTTASQIDALQKARILKIKQIENKILQTKIKIKAQEAALKAAENDYILKLDQYQRQEKLYYEGLISQTKLQQSNASLQNAMAKKIEFENKLAESQQEIINFQIEQNGETQNYAEKINKAQGEKLTSYTEIASGEGEIAKLENKVTNYTIRNGMYIITAPQAGQITQAMKSGIGEIIKDSEKIVTIIPEKVNYAVEIFVKPRDLPLVNIGQDVRFIFDGYPAIVFSGWPEGSYGTFGGKIVAYENNINDQGLFRVLVTENPEDQKWPTQLKIGNAVQGIALLKEVPIWYEIWRNINGFPPDYYIVNKKKNEKEKQQ